MKVVFVGVARQADLALVACHPQGHPLQSAVVSMLGSLTTVEDGRLYSFSVQQSAWHLVQADGQIFLINTVLDYPSSVASQALEDLRQLFGKVTPERLGKATSGSLSGSFRAPFAALCAKYDDVAQVSKLHATLAKVEGVKLVMQDNIQAALDGCAQLDNIENQSDLLMNQASAFKQNATSLKKRMWWKNCKAKAIMIGIVLVLATVAGLLVADSTGAFDD